VRLVEELGFLSFSISKHNALSFINANRAAVRGGRTAVYKEEF
jgi:hypothetical protein